MLIVNGSCGEDQSLDYEWLRVAEYSLFDLVTTDEMARVMKESSISNTSTLENGSVGPLSDDRPFYPATNRRPDITSSYESIKRTIRPPAFPV